MALGRPIRGSQGLLLFPRKTGTGLCLASPALPEMQEGWVVALIKYHTGTCRYEDRLPEPGGLLLGRSFLETHRGLQSYRGW